MRYIIANVRNVLIGHNEPTVVQSMCNCDTNDIESAVAQCREMYLAGARLVRLTTQGKREVESLAVIKDRLTKEGIDVPLVADVHPTRSASIPAISPRTTRWPAASSASFWKNAEGTGLPSA